jgi:acyl carrier protein
MMRNRDDILNDVLLLLRQLADDWEYSGAITEDTNLFADMGFQSMDVVILATAVQEHYQRVLPFTEFFAELGEREQRDISIREWIDFVYANLADQPALRQHEVVA